MKSYDHASASARYRARPDSAVNSTLAEYHAEKGIEEFGAYAMSMLAVTEIEKRERQRRRMADATAALSYILEPVGMSSSLLTERLS